MMRAGGAAATGTDVELVRGAAVARWELYFLIHSFLDSGPCSETAQVLKRELTARGLLPTHGYTGTPVRMTPEDITARYAGATGRDLGGLLPALLERLVDIRASGTGPGPTLPRTLLSGGMQTLLQGHCHRLASDSVPPRVSGRATSSGAPPAGCYAAGSCSALRGKTPPHGRSMLQHVLARQQGCRRARRWPLPSTPNSLGLQYGRLYTLLAHFKHIFMAIFDRTGQRMVTGSDDKLVKIWNVHRGELLFSLRGHQGDITMIDINPANTIIASADTRGWVRVWRLCDGVPLVALRAHTAANTEPPSENEAAAEIAPREVKHISFLTHGDDEFLVCAVHGGTCPIWKVDTSSTQQAAAAQVSICTEYDVVRVRSNHNGGASRTLPSPSRHGALTSPLLPDAAADAEISLPLTCCDVNASKTHIAVGCSDTNIYIFEIFPTVSKAAAKTRARSRRVATLSGHTKGVDGVRFGHINDGSIGRLVSSSEDETVRIWSAAKASGGVLRYVSVACLDLRPPSLTRLRSPLRGGRGRGGGRATSSGAHTRLLSMKCEITMIAWSIDDSRVVTATKVPKADAEAGTYSAVLQVWDTGPRNCVEEVGKSRLLRALGTHGHAHQACVDMAVYVLVPHPSNKRLMLSAGYDGRAFIWDICSGLPLLRLMESAGTSILEGQFSGDGMNIVLCDADGFLSVYGAGSPPVCLKEQFFLHDYGQLNYDHAGNVQDTAAQIAPHLMPRQLCDSESTVYPRALQPRPPSQSIPQFGHVDFYLDRSGSIPNPAYPSRYTRIIQYWNSNSDESSRHSNVPLQRTQTQGTIVASEGVRAKARSLAIQGYEVGTATEIETIEVHVPDGDILADTVPSSDRHINSGDINHADRLSRLSQPALANDHGGIAAASIARQSPRYRDDDEEEEEGDDVEDDDPNDGDVEEDAVESSSDDDDDDDDDDDVIIQEGSSRSRGRSLRRRTRHAESDGSDYEAEAELAPTRRSRRVHKRPRYNQSSDSDGDQSADESDAPKVGAADSRAARAARRSHQAEDVSTLEEYFAVEDDTIQSISAWFGLDEDEMLELNKYVVSGLRRMNPTQAKKIILQAGTRLLLSDKVGAGWDEGSDDDSHADNDPQLVLQNQRQKRAARRQRSGSLGPRQNAPPDSPLLSCAGGLPAWHWLHFWTTSVISYVPQVGDNVTYIQDIHKTYLEAVRHQLQTSPPWVQLRDLQSVEHCRVESLNYGLAQPPTIDKTYVRIILTRIPATEGHTTRSSRSQSSFELIYTPIHAEASMEFLVLSSCYDAAVAKTWRAGMQVTVPYLHIADEGHANDHRVHEYEPFTATIARVEDRAQASEYFGPSIGSLANSIYVTWDNDNGGETLSPWELYIAGSDESNDFAAITLRLALNINEQKRLAVEIAAINGDEDQMFRADPTSFPQYADEIACPMFLDLLQQRLEHGYYRTIDHLRHEINLIRANYVMFNSGEDTSNVDRLCKRLHSLVDESIQQGLDG